MKKLAAGLLAGVILVGGVAVAAGTSADQTLITQAYLNDRFIPSVVQQAGEKADTGLGKVYDSAAARLKALSDAYLAQAGGLAGQGIGYAEGFTEQRFKRGDVLTLNTGSSVLLLAGSAAVSFERGGVVDVSEGLELASGGALAPNHRYLAAEDTVCKVTVTSDTAVLALEGFYSLAESTATDYNALAGALKSMGLFKGADTAYGSGYDLEKVPTRIEGLIMFLRLIGEEGNALAYTEPCPFVDVPDWCRSYVSYAYAMGYAKGVGADSTELYFNPMGRISAGEYTTFVLRSLDYRDSGEAPDFSWDSALMKALEFKCINAQEHQLLTQAPFLRAQVVYLSYYALDAGMKSGGTLLEHLSATGALDMVQVQSVRSTVTVQRIS